MIPGFSDRWCGSRNSVALRVCAAPRIPPSTRCKFDVWFGAATRCNVEQEGAAMIGVGAFRVLPHPLPGRGNEQARKILADKSGTTRLPRRNAETAQMLALGAVDVNAAAT